MAHLLAECVSDDSVWWILVNKNYDHAQCASSNGHHHNNNIIFTHFLFPSLLARCCACEGENLETKLFAEQIW